MKFYGNGVVWDSKKGKVLCKFKNGVYETEEKYQIDQLLERGYENDGVQQEEVREEEVREEEVREEEVREEEVTYEDMTNSELKAILEERGHTGLGGKNKKQLIDLIEGD